MDSTINIRQIFYEWKLYLIYLILFAYKKLIIIQLYYKMCVCFYDLP